MGIIIVSFLVLVFGIIALVIHQCKYSDCLFKGDNWFFFGMLCTIIGGVVMVVCGIMCLCINADINVDLEYQNILLERKSIEHRLEEAESEDSFMTNGGVYYDAVRFNNELRAYKTYTHNFWVGLFWADKPAKLEYIELDLEGF